MDKLWQAKLEINTKNIMHNIKTIKEFIGGNVDIMPVIKDDGYRTGIDQKIDIYEKTDIKIVGVAIVDEAVTLRENGFKGEIFILNQIYEEDIVALNKYDITVGIGSIQFLSKLGAHSNEQFKIHIEVGTGMGRTGIHPNRVQEFLDEARKYPNIKIEGIYTHFSCSDCDAEYTKAQIESFNRSVDVVKQEIPDLKYIHCCNSAGILNFPEAHFNLVRPGIILYGYYPAEDLKNKLDLKPAIRLKSKVSFLKEVEKGTGISYGRTFITQRKSKIATIQLGYADGIRRSMSNKGKVVINGKKAPIIGKVCMDCFMVDVTDLENIKVGDEVFIWDNEYITVEDIANIYDTINYEVISTISNRVVREYI